MNYKAIIYPLSPTFTLVWDYGTTNPNLNSGQINVQLGNFESYFEVREIKILINETIYYLMPVK